MKISFILALALTSLGFSAPSRADGDFGFFPRFQLCEGDFNVTHSNGQAASLSLRTNERGPFVRIEGNMIVNGEYSWLDGTCERIGHGTVRISFVLHTQRWGNLDYQGTLRFQNGRRTIDGTTQNGRFSFHADSAGSPAYPSFCEGFYDVIHSNGQRATMLFQPSGGGNFRQLSGNITINGETSSLDGQCQMNDFEDISVRFTIHTRQWGDIDYIGSVSYDRGGREIISGTTQNGRFSFTATQN